MAEHYARPPLPFSPELLQACHDYTWPGNLRELSNFIKRYLVLGDEKLAINELQSRKSDGAGAHIASAAEYGRRWRRTEISGAQRER